MVLIAAKPWQTLPFEVNVSRDGPANGLSHINKFGHNPSIESAPPSYPEDVWSGGGKYTFTADGGAPYFISSSNAGDTEEIALQCLVQDAAGDWIEENITMTLQGQTKVPIVFDSGLDPVRFYRGFNANGTDLLGNVYIYEDDTLTGGVPDTATKIRGVIAIGDGQTEMCIYTIPSGKVGYFLQGYVQLANSKTSHANFTYSVRAYGGVFRVQGRAACDNVGSNHWIYRYAIPPKMPAKTDVIISCVEVGANLTSVAGGFDILLEDIV